MNNMTDLLEINYIVIIQLHVHPSYGSFQISFHTEKNQKTGYPF